MSNIFKLNDKPDELKTKEELEKEYEEITGKKYTEPTEEERREILKKYGIEE